MVRCAKRGVRIYLNTSIDTHNTSKESHEKDQVAMMQQEIAELDVMISDLKALTARHATAQERLDSMYERVFAGPSVYTPPTGMPKC